jgi:hypothetical protein
MERPIESMVPKIPLQQLNGSFHGFGRRKFISTLQNQHHPSTSYLDSGRKMVFQSCFMSTTSQLRLGASLRASTSLPVLFVLAS